MKPEFASRRVFGITRAKGKMYEFGLPEASHLAVPQDIEPSALFPLTVGTLADVAAYFNDAENIDVPLPPNMMEEISFSASFFDAFLESRFWTTRSHEVLLLAAAAYYLGQRQGSSLVLARRIGMGHDQLALDGLLSWLLCADWTWRPEFHHHLFGGVLDKLAGLVLQHFYDGSGVEQVATVLREIRERAYLVASSRDQLLAEIASAVVRLRLADSAWARLPAFTGISSEQWAPAIRRPGFPKELWPSQKLLGKAGLFSGRSGVVQMPTSAGKTRSVEIVLRSGFLSGRVRLAVVVAPFRALCHEIATSLRHAFRGEDIKVNEISDALQMDFMDQLAELLGMELSTSCNVLALTPEKLLYVLRQEPSLVSHIGVVIYDEGHQFDSGGRGITYELLLTEIKNLLPEAAQTVLVSAVIKNADSVGKWLIGDSAKVVNGSGLLSTARSVAFATWLERLGQLHFYEAGGYDRHDYFVPRAIESQELKRRPRERTERVFPERGDDAWKDVSLYLGIKLAPQGAVAVFCGRKDTASGLVNRAVEVYERGFNLDPPSSVSDAEEIGRLVHLIQGNFGKESTLAHAARLGIFVHHGNTPHGIRLAIEYAMQHELIKLVVCTSTLAQGVNLPIRYLIVSGINQGADRIKTRDFQNLVGRAGRAGMHTEGLVIFADPRVLDRRRRESWRFEAAIELLNPENAEDTTSSLLELLAPIVSPDGRSALPVATVDLCRAYFLDDFDLVQWAESMVQQFSRLGFDVRSLVSDLMQRRKLLAVLESYLMANRGEDVFEAFKNKVRQLATSTLAHYLAKEEEKEVLVFLFELAADHIEVLVPEVERQASFAKTLLGVEDAKVVEAWVSEHRERLLVLTTSDEWLEAIWPLFGSVIQDKFFGGVEPAELPLSIATSWLRGVSYGELVDMSFLAGGTKPWGEEARRRLTESDVVGFLEGRLGFDCPLVLAAVSQFLFGAQNTLDKRAAALTLFQKSLKYGLPDWLSITCFDIGFADRFLALELKRALVDSGYQGTDFVSAQKSHAVVLEAALGAFPRYYSSVFEALV